MYTLKIGNNLYVRLEENTLTITKDCNDASRYNRIGDAMKVASEINNELGAYIVRIETLNTPVSSKL